MDDVAELPESPILYTVRIWRIFGAVADFQQGGPFGWVLFVLMLAPIVAVFRKSWRDRFLMTWTPAISLSISILMLALIVVWIQVYNALQHALGLYGIYSPDVHFSLILFIPTVSVIYVLALLSSLSLLRARLGETRVVS